MRDIHNEMNILSNQIALLKSEYKKLRSTYIEELQDKLSVLVGMSFKDEDNNYFRIIDIPHIEYDKACPSFNEYQFPVLLCCTDPTIRADVGRLVIITKYSLAAVVDDPVKQIRCEYIEISAEKFDAELEKAFDEIRTLGKRGDAK